MSGSTRRKRIGKMVVSGSGFWGSIGVLRRTPSRLREGV